jgi:Polyketide cyclase / dehydrase and lipid transport
MRSDTKSKTIGRHPRDVVAFLAEVENLPRWAVAFATSVRKAADRWEVVTRNGAVIGMSIEADEATGVIDFRMEPEPGVEAVAHARVLPNGDRAEVLFTQFQQPGMADDVFAQLVASVDHELTALKAVLEADCPL